MTHQNNIQRAKEIRVRLYAAGITIQSAADKIGRAREYVSRVLLGKIEYPTPVLDALEKLLDETNDETPQHAAAMAA
jgi:transcriptional regulator with XRE-family HTH domain